MEEKARKFWRWHPKDYVAETIFFVFKISESLLEPSLRLYVYQELCFKFSDFKDKSICLDISKYPEKEVELQTQAALYLTLYRVLVNLPALFLCAFCGSWSDKVGRKRPIVISSITSIIGVCFFIVNCNLPNSYGVSSSSSSPPHYNSSESSQHWNRTSGVEARELKRDQIVFVVMMLLGSVFRGLSGKGSVITMAVHSHVSDVSDRGSRTERLGFLLSMNFFGLFVGSLAVGTCLEAFGFGAMFVLVVFLHLSCILLASLLMDGGRAQDCQRDGKKSKSADPAKDAAHGCRSNILFHWRNIRDFIRLLVDFPSARVFFFFILVVVQQGCKSGEIDVTLLFTMKAPLSWSKSLYGYFLAADYACLGLATSVLLPLLIKIFKTCDVSLAILGVAFKVVRVTILSVSSSTWMVFMSAVLGCPSALIISCLKSLVSKSFQERDLGKIFALLSGCETFSNLIGNITFNYIYVSSLSFYSGFLFLLEAFIFFLLLLGLIHVGIKETSECEQEKPFWDSNSRAQVNGGDYGAFNEALPSIVLDGGSLNK